MSNSQSMKGLVKYLNKNNAKNSIQRNAKMNPTQSNGFVNQLIKSDSMLKTLLTNSPIVSILKEIRDSLECNSAKPIKEHPESTKKPANDGAEFWQEGAEAKRVKRETKSITLLEKIAGGFKGLTLSGGSSGGSSGGGILSKMFGDSTIYKAVAGGAVGSALAGLATTILAGLGTAIGGLFALGSGASFLQGVFNSEDIAGTTKLTGLKGFIKTMGAGFAQVFSNMTLGKIKAKDIYKYMEKTTISIKETTTKILGEIMSAIDGQLVELLGDNYKDIKDGIKFTVKGIGKVYDKVKSPVGKAYDFLTTPGKALGGYMMKKIDGLNDTGDAIKGDKMLNRKPSNSHGVGGSFGADEYKDDDSLSKKSNTNSSLADAIKKRHAKGKDTTGSCAFGVREVTGEAGLTPKGLGLGDAYQQKDNFKKYGFKVIGGENRTDYDAINDLPAGYNVVFGKGQTDEAKRGKHVGHSMITTANGGEYSDHYSTRKKSIERAKKLKRPFTILKAPDKKGSIQTGTLASKLQPPKPIIPDASNAGNGDTYVSNKTVNQTNVAPDLSTDDGSIASTLYKVFMGG